MGHRTPKFSSVTLAVALALAAVPPAQAGDILRGGAANPAANAPTATSGTTTAQAAKAQANAADALARTTQALQSVQAMQNAARKIALSGPNKLGQNLPTVPNGLIVGGLQVDPAKLWTGATLKPQTISSGKTRITIVQTQSQALLNWKTFNIGKQTAVTFDQTKGGSDSSQWIAFNKINDPSGNPTQILGSLDAIGQVYLINQNGIVFGGSSQVNTHNLTASALPMNDGLVARGLLNNPSSDFLFSALNKDSSNIVPAGSLNFNFTTSEGIAVGTVPVVTANSGSNTTALSEQTDYTLTKDATGKTIVTLTSLGLNKASTRTVNIAYTVSGGSIYIQAGAIISTPTTPEHVGGRVFLAGPNVINHGTISTPDGQTILAAGRQVAIAAHAKSDPSLRGLDIFVGSVDGASGMVTNTGLITSLRSNIILTGKEVAQNGYLNNSTSVSLNGRIDLLADYGATANPAYATDNTQSQFLFSKSGSVSLGASSVAQILPEVNSDESVIGTQLTLPSLFSLRGQSLRLGTGAIILAPNALLPTGTNAVIPKDNLGNPLLAGISANAGRWNYVTANGSASSNFVHDSGQIYLDAGATINAAGSVAVPLPISRQFLTLQLRGTELADSPLQREGPLRGNSIVLDLRIHGPFDPTLNEGQGDYTWVGTPLADARGFRDLIKRSVGELTTDGGTVSLLAGNSVVLQRRASVDVSGGWLSYQGGMVETSRVFSDGQVFDISQATPDRVYGGLYTGNYTRAFAKYGINETYANALALNGSHFEAGYIQGANGGSISITAPSQALDGTLRGLTVAGPRQRDGAQTLSALSLSYQAQAPDPTDSSGRLFKSYSPTPPNIVFRLENTLAPVAALSGQTNDVPISLSEERKKNVVLSPELLTTFGFGTLSIDDSDGNITIPSNVPLLGAPGGRLSLKASNLTLNSSILIPSGTLSFTVYDVTPTPLGPVILTPAIDPGRGQLTLSSLATLSTAGLSVDDRLTLSDASFFPLLTDGGTISLSAFNMDLAKGSLLDVSGGVAVSSSGKLAYGNGGSLAILSGVDPSGLPIGYDPATKNPTNSEGNLRLGATLRGFSGSKSGSLTIKAPLIQIANSSSSSVGLHLTPNFFNQGGFANFTLLGIGQANPANASGFSPGVIIAPNTEIAPLVTNTIALPASFGSLAMTPILLPQSLRTSVSITFGTQNFSDSGRLLLRGDFVMGAGSLIEIDPGGSVSIGGSDQAKVDTANVLGSILAPGGSIRIAGSNDSRLLFPKNLTSLHQPLSTVFIGSNSLLSTAGTTVLTEDPRGFRTGKVLGGGTVSLSGNLVTAKGARIDVSGIHDTLDYLATQALNPGSGLPLAAGNESIIGSLAGSRMIALRVESNAGSIILKGGQELFTSATLTANAGGASSSGGMLTVSSGLFSAQSDLGTTVSPTSAAPDFTGVSYNNSNLAVPSLEITQTQDPYYINPASPIGSAVYDSKALSISGIGRFAADAIIHGGGHFAVDTMAAGGFDAISLKGILQTSGDVIVTANREIIFATGGVLLADPNLSSSLHLIAPHIALGTPFLPPQDARQTTFPFTLASLYGSGKLTLSGNLLDIGNVVLQGVGKADFVATNGDIRGNGTLSVSGDIYLNAGQIYPPTATRFTIAASDYIINNQTQAGSVTITGSGRRQLPLSGGGELNVYGSLINQMGTIRAPFGTIHLGNDGTGSSVIQALSGQAVATTQNVTLGTGSITSVSGYDEILGRPVIVPYGVNQNGTAWFDPAGVDISNGGLPQKSVTVEGAQILNKKGSLIDIRGGGELYAYQFVKGTGGSRDILATTTSFAIIPGYAADYSPSDALYSNIGLRVGDLIHLDGSKGLSEGFYTLLPARYALIKGAYLVTPYTSMAVGSIALPDGSALVSGYRSNAATTFAPEVVSRYLVASYSIVRSRSEFVDFLADKFFQSSSSNTTGLRLPSDAGQLVLSAISSLALHGRISAQATNGAHGGLVDISSSSDIYITGSHRVPVPGQLALDSADLSRFGAESLLIGGVRSLGNNGDIVSVTTNNITVDNEGSLLTAPDLILAANSGLTVAANARIVANGNTSLLANNLLVGNTETPGSGNGAFLRVSSDPSAGISRQGTKASSKPFFAVGDHAIISGGSINLDSTYASTLSATAKLYGNTITLGSGQISLALKDAGPLQPTVGLVLSGDALQSLQNANALSLLSYTSIDLYGTGNIGSAGLSSLSLHTGEFRGFNNQGRVVTFQAENLFLDNKANSSVPGSIALPTGSLAFYAKTIFLGANTIEADQFAGVTLSGANGIFFSSTGSFTAANSLTLNAPLVTGSSGAIASITATAGILTIADPTNGNSHLAPGLGAKLTLTGSSIVEQSRIYLPSGLLTLRATTGDIQVDGRIDVSGNAQAFFDLTKYSDGGKINLLSDAGAIFIGTSGSVDVSAPSFGGDAGSVSVITPKGRLTLLGKLFGGAGSGRSGSFNLDASQIVDGNLTSVSRNLVGFEDTRSIRDQTDASVTIDGISKVRNFNLSLDAGSILVTGSIDGSGATGGSIDMQASGSITLGSTAVLTVAAEDFDNAGKAGSISLAAGSEVDGQIDSNAQLDFQAGSILNLSVASNSSSDPAQGKFSGTLHLRAPQNLSGDNLRISELSGNILGASKITLEGYKLYQATGSAGTITTTIQNAIQSNGNTFADNSSAILAGLYARNPNKEALSAISIVTPGAEIINPSGSLTLASDWNLAGFRFGPRQAPGILTLRAQDNLVFNGSLSDGFVSALYNSALLSQNTDGATGKPYLPANAQSWSYHLTSGADFTGADYHDVKTITTQTGSLQLGVPGIGNTPAGSNAKTSQALAGHYQVIRTGSGDIDISAALDVQLQNPFATIYTAGTQVLSPKTPGGLFDIPILNNVGTSNSLGTVQQSPTYPVQYSLAGGNVEIRAQGDILHTDDSEKQLPNNWLYRRGAVGADGLFLTGVSGDVQSTSWWVDFSNFFEGVGALGGGNVSLIAGNNITNVDAAIPTNARMPGKSSSGQKMTPDVNTLVELGGGDLLIQAGNDIDAGAYYVERGKGTLSADGSIHTNSTRSPAGRPGAVASTAFPEPTWLPTTLFLGKSTFDVFARGDITLGPAANVFLLPQGLNNTVFYKSYFSTYDPATAINIASQGGSVTLREAATFGSSTVAQSLLLSWINKVENYNALQGTIAYTQPWLRLAENGGTSGASLNGFSTSASLLPPTVNATSFSKDINLIGNFTFSPAANSTIELAALGSINGLGINGIGPDLLASAGSAKLNFSDADPDSLPGVTKPYSQQQFLGISAFASRGSAGAALSRTPNGLFSFLDSLFNESGSTDGILGSIETKQALHSPGVLHKGDTQPLRFYATTGNIADFSLSSAKAVRVLAGANIGDVGLYLQNANDTDISLISAGGNITLFDPASSLLQLYRGRTNSELNNQQPTQSGDIQIGGLGTLEVLAGGNLDLGNGRTLNDPVDLDIGISSIGNTRNPYLPFAGANIIVSGGLGHAGSLDNSSRDIAGFLNFLTAARLDLYLTEIAWPGVASSMEFRKLSSAEQATIALDIFYRVLRDAGRAHNNADNPSFGTYSDGFSAIAALFPQAGKGDISLSSRSIVTTKGGNISIAAPGGGLSLGSDIQSPPAGIITQAGGRISIFVDSIVDVGVQRIFTLRGGDETIWASHGDIAAGASSKTVQSAPPTRVLIDPQSADVQTDLAGLSTGGGIGVLASVTGVAPADVDLIAPSGTVDAGDAGIQATGNLSIAAVSVLNADNIQVAGTSAGVPTVVAPTVNLAGLAAANTTSAAGTQAAADVARQNQNQGQPEELPSVITVEIVGYGG